MMWKDRRGISCLGVLFALGAALLLMGCKRPSAGEVSPPPTVQVAQVSVQDVPIYSEWTASTDGFVNATIRAQVQGYLIERDYQEGEFVKKGQILFRIDPRPFQATLEQANGQLSQAQARWTNSKANLERIKPLVEQRAVSLRELDDATGNEQVNYAAVVSAQAVVDKAQLDLGFTRIISPIAGIAGIAKAQIGNLVGPGSVEELTTVSTVDPIKVYVPMSEQEFLKIVETGQGRTDRMPLELILADGRIHPGKGAFASADRQVDVKTGTIKVAALFPNPGNVVRPGQFARVRAQTAIKKGACLVPQRAVVELQGNYQVAVVGSDGKVAIRTVKAAERVDSLWVIDEGVKAGERVVAEGLQKVKDGAFVTATPFTPKPTAGFGHTAGVSEAGTPSPAATVSGSEQNRKR